jgi:hypothetical protein
MLFFVLASCSTDAHRIFFRLLGISLVVPRAVQKCRKALADGKSCIICFDSLRDSCNFGGGGGGTAGQERPNPDPNPKAAGHSLFLSGGGPSGLAAGVSASGGAGVGLLQSIDTQFHASQGVAGVGRQRFHPLLSVQGLSDVLLDVVHKLFPHHQQEACALIDQSDHIHSHTKPAVVSTPFSSSSSAAAAAAAIRYREEPPCKGTKSGINGWSIFYEEGWILPLHYPFAKTHSPPLPSTSASIDADAATTLVPTTSSTAHFNSCLKPPVQSAPPPPPSNSLRYLRALVCKYFGPKRRKVPVMGTIVAHLPAACNDGEALWHVVYADGDEEDWEEDEVGKRSVRFCHTVCA